MNVTSNVLILNKGDAIRGLKQVHHIAHIATYYAVSKAFFFDILGFDLLSEVWRAERDSWMGDFALNGPYVIELFSFPFPPPRPRLPEACDMRLLVFRVENGHTPVSPLAEQPV